MKIVLLGYGKMGKEIEQIALQRKHEIVLKVDEHNAKTFSLDEFKKADVAIEFSTPESVIENIYKCFSVNVPVVVGTTGWYDNADEVKKSCKEKNGALFYASNFSIGVNVFFKVNEYLAKIMNNYSEYDVSMEEIHHVHKLDAPSGTAITLAKGILENLKRKKSWMNAESKNAEELSIISKRLGEVYGTHRIKYFSALDEINISHEAHNRKGFALGAVLAAEFIIGKKGVFGMNDLLDVG